MRNFISKDELDHEVLYVLMSHPGEPNAILRPNLVARIFNVSIEEASGKDNTCDRQVRQSIERMRHQGHLICNTGDGVGYYIAQAVEEYQAFREAYGSHAFPIMRAIEEMDKAAKQKWPNPLQPRML